MIYTIIALEKVDIMLDNNKKYEGFIKLIIYVIAIILTYIYILYRIIYTLPLKLGWLNLVFGILLLFVEIYETIDFTIYFFNILRYSKKSLEVLKIKENEYPEVDVFIATINESEELLSRTIEGCLNMKYPYKDKVHIYLCDDGNRLNIKLLARKYNINYITRKDNKGAKAGNYNNAIKNSHSPLIATFDADMCPTENFLLTTIPFFIKYDKVGFVQLPQSFLEPDIFQLRFGLSKDIPFEQDYFYHRIQIAKNNTNSTIYCGTNAVISRKALKACNGFSLKSISEDIATGMLIESCGFRGISLNNVEAYGYATQDLEAFCKQRSRWGRGCIQMFKNHKILRNKGLSLSQKLEYLSSVSYWFYGVKRIIFLLVPLLFSLFGIITIDCSLLIFSCFFFPQYLVKRIALDLLEGKRRSSTWNKIYEIILAPIMAGEAIKELFGFGSTKFEVTPKEKWSSKMSKANKKLISYHTLFLVLTIFGIVLSIYKITLTNITTYLFPLLWLIVNLFYLVIALIFDFRINPIYYDNFIPNNTYKYRFKSIPSIFLGIFKKKFKGDAT